MQSLRGSSIGWTLRLHNLAVTRGNIFRRAPFTSHLFYFIINIFSSIQIGKRLCGSREVIQSAGDYAS